MFDEHSDDVHWLPETLDRATVLMLERTFRKVRKHGRKDGNQKEIETGLRQLGCEVYDTSPLGDGFPDIICLFRGELFAFEVKRGRKAELTGLEKEFHNRWKSSHVAVIYDLDDAFRILNINKQWKPGHAR